MSQHKTGVSLQLLVSLSHRRRRAARASPYTCLQVTENRAKVLSIPGRVAIIIFGGTIGALIYKELRSSNKTRNLNINATVLAVIVILFMVFIIAMFMPLTANISGLRQ